LRAHERASQGTARQARPRKAICPV
jgi:hypothetical protein